MTDLELKPSALNVQVNRLLIVIQYGQFGVETRSVTVCRYS